MSERAASLFRCRLVTWKVYVDAGWFLDIPGFGATADSRPMRDIAMTLQTAYNASFDATCMAQLLPGQVREYDTAWICRAELVHCQQHARTCARTCILLLSRLQDQDGSITHHCNSADQQLNERWLLQRWACFFGHYWWQHFPLPTFLGEFLYDSANLGDITSL